MVIRCVQSYKLVGPLSLLLHSLSNNSFNFTSFHPYRHSERSFVTRYPAPLDAEMHCFMSRTNSQALAVPFGLLSTCFHPHHLHSALLSIAVLCIPYPTLSHSVRLAFLSLPVCFLDTCHNTPLPGNLVFFFIMSTPVRPFFFLQIYLCIYVCLMLYFIS